MGVRHPVAWAFHLNTSRHAFNTLGADTAQHEPSFLEYPRSRFVSLPECDAPAMPLGDALAARVSCRCFSDEPLLPEHLSALLTAAYGVTGQYVVGDLQYLERPVPSGGGLYPLELFVLARRVRGLDAGVFHYAPLHRGLECLDTPLPDERWMADLFLDQPYAARAPVIVVVCAVLERSMEKYGDRGYRYILLEAGHAVQNAVLVAGALGLGSLCLGGFFDRDLAGLLEVPWPEVVPLYALALGAPRRAGRVERRQPD